MKVLYAHLHDPSFGMGGADRGVSELITEMARRPVQVMVLTNAGPFADALKAQQIPVRTISRSKWKTCETLKIFSQTVNEFKPDLIHSHHRYTTFLLSVFLRGRAPVLHTERIQLWNKRFLYRYGDFATAVSEGLRRHLIQYYHVPEEKVMTIVNAVRTKPAAAEKIRQYETSIQANGRVKVLFVGRLDEQKGHSYLIEAVSQLPVATREQFVVLLAGDGPLEMELRERVKTLGLEKQFQFLGYCQDVAELLTLSDFLVLPSLWEGLPRVVLEAFAFRKPVIATRIPGTLDVVRDDYNGLLVPARDPAGLAGALSKMVGDSALRARLAKGAEESSLQYSFPVMAENYYRLYQKMGKSSCAA